MPIVPPNRLWRGGIGTGKSAALRSAVRCAVDSAVRPIAWLPALSDVGLRTERVAFPDSHVAGALGASGLEGRLIRNLSSGERQRVRLALALSPEVRFAALDEPCRHLDPAHIEALNQLLAARTVDGLSLAAAESRSQLSPCLFRETFGTASDDGSRPEPCLQPRGKPLRLAIPVPFLPAAGRRTGKRTCEVAQGSIVALQGSNGSGKTSLLEALARSARGAGAKLGFSRQEPEHQIFAATARAELREVAAAHGRAPWAEARVDRLGLTAWLGVPTPRLPLGAMCLFGAAIALQMGRDLVLLDEPTQGLDTPAARMLARELVRCASLGARVIVATHDPELVRVANRHWYVDAGQWNTEAVA